MRLDLLFAVVALLAFGITGIVYKIATAHIDPISLTFFVYVLATVFTALVWLFTPDKHIITRAGLTWVVLAAFFAVIGMIAYMVALQVGEVSIVTPIRDLAVVVTVLLAIFVLGEHVTVTKALGLLFGIAAVVLLSLGR